MPNSARVLTRLAAIVLVGGLTLGVCFAALIPGARQIATAQHYTGTVNSLGELSSPTTVYDANGGQIGKLGSQDREPAELAEVPQILINAVIDTEDKTFWKNPGIDVGGVSRAFVDNLTKGRISQGGSTITQQLVKNRILGNKQDLQRKAKELILAYRLNDKYSKREILKQYLNTVYFGQGSYGVKATARRFFLTPDPSAPFGVRGKALSELTVGEAALLAGVIRNPEGDNPFVHPDAAAKRRAEVLTGMVKAHHITQAQADQATQEPLPTVKPTSELRPENAWAEHAQQVLLNDPRLGATPQERRDKVLQGGLKVYTTKDPNLQQMADDAVANGLRGAKAGFGAALVAMDPKTGYVKAMADNRPFNESKFNLATDGAGRQVGSSFKVTTLATILANGYSRNDQVDGTDPCSVPGFGREIDEERRTRRRLDDGRQGDRRLGQLRVRAHVDGRRDRQGHRHGAEDGHAAQRLRPPARQRMEGAHVHVGRHLDHAGRDGEHHGDDRGRRRPPRPDLRVEGRRRRREGRVRRDRPARHPRPRPRRRQLRGEHPPRPDRDAAPLPARGYRARTPSARRAPTTTRSAPRSSAGRPTSCRSSGTATPTWTNRAPGSGRASRTRSGATS